MSERFSLWLLALMAVVLSMGRLAVAGTASMAAPPTPPLLPSATATAVPKPAPTTQPAMSIASNLEAQVEAISPSMDRSALL